MRSIRAGLAAYDSLIILDEAHTSRAFAETLGFIDKYRGWANVPLELPFTVVEMSATPRGDAIRETPEDLENEILKRRWGASKRTKLVAVEPHKDEEAAKGGFTGLVEGLVREARVLRDERGGKVIGVIANRVRTARRVHESLAKDEGCKAILLTGRSRPYDRDRIWEKWKPVIGLGGNRDSQEIVFVADAMTGQEAVRVAKAFHEKLAISGVILTKTDGDARGGAALSLRDATKARLLYVGTGEAVGAFEVFDPARMAGRILGMGDVVGLVERAQERLDQGEVERLGKKMSRNQFDLEDMLSQIRQVKKLGSVMDIIGMIPGAGKLKEKAGEIDEKVIGRTEAVLSSMTRQERKSPKIIDGRRRLRIAKGSGTDLQQVNQVLKQYEQMKQMMTQFGKMGGKMKHLQKLAGARGGKGGFPGFPGM